MSDQIIILWLFAVPIAALLCVAVRTQYRIARGRESGQLRRPNAAEAAASAAALAAAFGVLF
jgi:C4-dicarboxylate-specific signal transduction histidine kinase